MIAPGDLTAEQLQAIGDQAAQLVIDCRRALFQIDLGERAASGVGLSAREDVCSCGARIAQLLGITAGIASIDPPSEPLVDFDHNSEKTLDMDPED